MSRRPTNVSTTLALKAAAAAAAIGDDEPEEVAANGAQSERFRLRRPLRSRPPSPAPNCSRRKPWGGQRAAAPLLLGRPSTSTTPATRHWRGSQKIEGARSIL